MAALRLGMARPSQGVRRRAKRQQANGLSGRGVAANTHQGSSATHANDASGAAVHNLPAAFRVPNVLKGFVDAEPLYAPAVSAMLYNQDAKTALRILDMLGQVH